MLKSLIDDNFKASTTHGFIKIEHFLLAYVFLFSIKELLHVAQLGGVIQVEVPLFEVLPILFALCGIMGVHSPRSGQHLKRFFISVLYNDNQIGWVLSGHRMS